MTTTCFYICLVKVSKEKYFCKNEVGILISNIMTSCQVGHNNSRKKSCYTHATKEKTLTIIFVFVYFDLYLSYLISYLIQSLVH